MEGTLFTCGFGLVLADNTVYVALSWLLHLVKRMTGADGKWSRCFDWSAFGRDEPDLGAGVGLQGVSEFDLTFLWRPPSGRVQTAFSVRSGFRPPSLRFFFSIALFFPYLDCDQTRVSLRAYSDRDRFPPFFFSIFRFHFPVPFFMVAFCRRSLTFGFRQGT